MKKNSDLIKPYAVKIESDFGKAGSGVLIKVDDDKCYLATAKHNFSNKGRDDSWKYVKKSFLDKSLSDISILQNDKEICKIVKILSFCDGYDSIIFEVEDLDDEFKRLDRVRILYEEDYNKDYEFFFHGYPIGKEDGSDDIIEKLTIRNDNKEKYTYDLNSSQPLRKKGLEGFSGSGVFIQDNRRLFLVGIVISRYDDLSFFTVFNLSHFLNKNEPLLIPLIKNITDLENIEDMIGRIIHRNPNNFLIQEYKQLFKGDKHKDSKLPDKAEEIGYLGKKFQITNQFIELEANYRKELADMYLLATIISKKFGEEILVREYFKKAIEYEPSYIRYLRYIEEEYSIEELMRDAKLALIEDRFHDAKIFFKALLYLNITDNQRIYCYEKILEIVKFYNNNDEEIIQISNKLLELYSEEDKLKKSILCYDLSIMNMDKSKQFYYVDLGLRFIENQEENQDFLEIGYKLKRRINELLEKKEDILNTKDPLIGLGDDLERLSSKHKYNIPYNQLKIKEAYKNIIYKQNITYKNTSKKISKLIWFAIVLAVIILFILLSSMSSLKSNHKIDKNITNCSSKNMNGFQVEECHFTGDINNTAILYDVNRTAKAIVLQGFPSNKSDFSQDKKIFLRDVFHYKIYDISKIKNIRIYGHTDLEYKNISSNRDLGIERALKVKKVISTEINKNKIETQYNPDFFMRDTDKILNNTLLKVLNLNDKINQLIDELQIPKNDTIEEIRNSFMDIDLSKYRRRFTPFRSVIILINLKEENLWDKIIRKIYSFYE